SATVRGGRAGRCPARLVAVRSARQERTVPFVERGGASIYYEEYGSGDPLLLLAPGGLNSSIQFWARMPLNPLDAFKDEFRIIAMDQRTPGRTPAPAKPPT